MRVVCIAMLLLACATAYSASFDYPVIGADYLQDATGRVYQVSRGYAERREFVKGFPEDVVEPGDVVNDASATSPFDSWYQMQWWLEDYCTLFLDTNAIAIAGTTNSLANWTLTSWREGSGVSSNGFRRATVYNPGSGDDWSVINGGMWTNAGNGYGYIQAGDILGPWVVDDIMRGMSTLIAVRYAANRGRVGWSISGSSLTSSAINLSEARDHTTYTNALNAYGHSFTNNLNLTYYGLSRYHKTQAYAPYWSSWSGTRVWSTSIVSEASTPIGTNIVYDWECVYQPTAGGHTWWCPEESWTENQWETHASGSGASGAVVNVASGIGAYGVSPLTITPLLPFWEAGDGTTYTNQCVEVRNVYFVVKPSFSHK